MSIEPCRSPESAGHRRDVYVDVKDFEGMQDPIAREAAIEAEVSRRAAEPDRPMVWRMRNGVAFSPWFKRNTGSVNVGRLESKSNRADGGFTLFRVLPGVWMQEGES